MPAIACGGTFFCSPNLDTASGEQVLAIFRKFVDETGRAIVMVTHDLDLAARTDRQIRIVDGRIVR